jgi:hypothetical protein
MIAGLPHDRHGRPIPWFVAVDESGTPDFRVVKARAVPLAVNGNLCWICGTHRGRESAFVIGPMCTVNRVSPEPPSHRECAKYAADECPFLSTPNMRRRETGLPADRVDPPGVAIMRNPGVTAVWFCTKWRPFETPDGGVLFEVGAPSRVSWRACGREATRDEVLASITSGYPLLVEAARKDGEAALAKLERQRELALRLLPPA